MIGSRRWPMIGSGCWPMIGGWHHKLQIIAIIIEGPNKSCQLKKFHRSSGNRGNLNVPGVLRAVEVGGVDVEGMIQRIIG